MPQDAIDLLVRRALRGAEVVVASPATIQKAIEKGEPITEPPRLSAEDTITKLFDERRQHALSLVSSFLPCPVSDTAILYLYDQIRLCILFNLDGAAITFCGMLVEYALKYATYRKENPGAASFDSSAWGQFEDIPLGPAITRARKAGLIDEAREKILHSFRQDLRNRYSRFNIQKITKDVSLPATEKNIETGEEKIVERTASTPT
jgi:hypothetical protein